MDLFEIFDSKKQEIIFEQLEKKLAFPNQDDKIIEWLVALNARNYIDDALLIEDISHKRFLETNKHEYLLIYADVKEKLTIVDEQLFDVLMDFYNKQRKWLSLDMQGNILVLAAQNYKYQNENLYKRVELLNDCLKIDCSNVKAYYLLYQSFSAMGDIAKAHSFLLSGISHVEKTFKTEYPEQVKCDYPDFFDFNNFCKRNISLKHMYHQNYSWMKSFLDKQE